MNNKKRIERFKWCNILLNTMIVIFAIANIMGVCGVIANLPFDTMIGDEIQRVVFSTSMRIQMTIGMTLSLVVCLYPLIQLKKIIRSINEKDIFSNENIKILKKCVISMVGYILLKAMGFILSIKFDIMHFKSEVASDVGTGIGELSSTGFGLTFDMNLLYLTCVVIFIVVLIEIIKAGKILKEENDLMI